MWLNTVSFHDRQLEHQRLELAARDALYYLGPNLTLRHCTLVLGVPTKRLLIDVPGDDGGRDLLGHRAREEERHHRGSHPGRAGDVGRREVLKSRDALHAQVALIGKPTRSRGIQAGMCTSRRVHGEPQGSVRGRHGA